MLEPPTRRALTSVPAARRLWLPWALRRRRAVEEMTRRSALLLGPRTTLVDLGRPWARYAGGEIANLATDAPIWQFWASGPDDAPPLVRACLASVDAHRGRRERIVLTASNYRDYVNLPEAVESRRDSLGWTHFSDVLRLALLEAHGGIWIDATVLLSGPLAPVTTEQPLFMFTRPEDPCLCATWFIASAPGHPLIRALRSILVDYHRHHDEIIDYFLMHHLFETLVTVNPRLREIWESVPVVDYNSPIHDLQWVLGQPAAEVPVADMIARSWLHKLSWKVEPDAGAAPSVQDWIVAHPEAYGVPT